MDNPAWTNGFTQFLAQNYSYKGRAGCNNMDAEHAPTFLKNRIAGLRANKKQVVETGWAYGSSATAPAATAALAPPAKNVSASPAQPPALEDHQVATVSAMRMATRTPRISALHSKSPTGTPSHYRYGSVIGCNRESSLAQAQSDLKTLEDAFRPARKIVEPGWEYKQ